MKKVITCEHAGNQIPSAYRHLFKNAAEILSTHRGYDPGAFDLFEHLKFLGNFRDCYLFSRLLIEPNRSLNHPSLFSEFTKKLPPLEKKKIQEEYYFPYRNRIETYIRETIGKGEEVVHFSVHTFTPILKGQTRNADLGLLFDPSRKQEKELCKIFKAQLHKENPGLNIRFNYPYLGKADGFTTHLRGQFPEKYSGIELEINQKFVHQNRMDENIKEHILKTISVIGSIK